MAYPQQQQKVFWNGIWCLTCALCFLEWSLVDAHQGSAGLPGYCPNLFHHFWLSQYYLKSHTDTKIDFGFCNHLILFFFCALHNFTFPSFAGWSRCSVRAAPLTGSTVIPWGGTYEMKLNEIHKYGWINKNKTKQFFIVLQCGPTKPSPSFWLRWFCLCPRGKGAG